MKKDYRHIFRHIETKAPRRELPGLILARIHSTQKRTAKTKCAFLSAVSLASFAALFPAFQYTWMEFARSGFYEYASLLFSDGTALLPYWKEFSLLLAESLPIFGLMLTFGLIFVFLESLKSTVKNMNVAFYKFN
jgi:hypothetical protein